MTTTTDSLCDLIMNAYRQPKELRLNAVNDKNTISMMSRTKTSADETSH